MLYKGSCHCGNIRFEVEADDMILAHECNCSICTKSGYLHLIVPNSRFELLHGKDDLNEYTFNSGIAKHFFCRDCGIKPFYIPRSNPDGYSINVNCLDPKPENIEIEKFDGKNWEQHAHTLKNLSKE